MQEKAASSPSVESVVLRPRWPEGLEQGRFYQFNCDDDGRDGDAFFRVLIANDGDVHLCASKRIERGFADPTTGLSTLRCTTIFHRFVAALGLAAEGTEGRDRHYSGWLGLSSWTMRNWGSRIRHA